MPDILIRDVNIPTRSDLLIHIYPGEKAVLYPFLGEPRKVEVVELPPHGDLIDRAEVLETVMQYVPDDDGSCSKANADLRELLDEIENVPVIIPASEEDTPNG